MSKKMITLDPKFLSLPKRGKSSKTQKKKELLKKTNIGNPGALRKQLLNKIKDYQKKKEETIQNKNEKSGLEEDFSGEFNKSLQFLSNLSSKKNKTHKKSSNYSGKNKHDNLESISVSTELPPELLDDSKMHIPRRNNTIKNSSKDQNYGCLKNGSKPTYREWKRKTQKNMDAIPLEKEPEPLSEREITLQKIKDNFKENKTPDISSSIISSDVSVSPKINIEIPKDSHLNNSNKTHANTPNKNTQAAEVQTEHRITTKKYKLGRNKTQRLVSILIKNKDTRKKVSKEKDNLKKKTIVEVKNYLKKCNLLKSGSDAPPDVLRTMYEQAVLTGNITNKAKDTLVHNFYNN